MADLATLARPYAEAVFKIAKQAHSATKWSDMLAFLATVASSPNIIAIAINPKTNKVDLQQLLLDISHNELNQMGRNFLQLLLANGRFMLLPNIAQLYEQKRAEDEGYVAVNVKTAYAFTKDEAQAITLMLEQKLNKSVHINVQKDKSLLAGFYAKAGDTVIDGSLKGQIQQLAKII